MHPIEFERIEQADGIACKELDRVSGSILRRRRAIGQAMTAHVVAYDAERVREAGRLRLPNVEAGAERIGEHQDRRVRRPGEIVVDGQFPGANESHGGAPLASPSGPGGARATPGRAGGVRSLYAS